MDNLKVVMCVPMELTLIPDGVTAFFCEIVFKQRVVHSLGLLMEKIIMLQPCWQPDGRICDNSGVLQFILRVV